jgi:hypothetical protein
MTFLYNLYPEISASPRFPDAVTPFYQPSQVTDGTYGCKHATSHVNPTNDNYHAHLSRPTDPQNNIIKSLYRSFASRLLKVLSLLDIPTTTKA